MNPPFDRGRDCDHVRHAFGFLKPGGILVAVMSARAEFRDDKRHRAFHRIVEQCRPAYGWMKWHDLPAGSFAHAGTNINTVIMAIRKPDCTDKRPASLCRPRAAPLLFPAQHEKHGKAPSR